MPRLSRNLLLIAALCWVAPASAQLAASEDEVCPNARVSRQVVIITEDVFGGVPISQGARALLP
jgi:hypothetical protein